MKFELVKLIKRNTRRKNVVTVGPGQFISYHIKEVTVQVVNKSTKTMLFQVLK